MWYWFYQCSQKASVDHSRRRGWLWLTESCSYSVASIASCRKFCSKLLQWMLRFVAMGSLPIVLLRSHPKIRFVPNHKKWTLYVGLLANLPEKVPSDAKPFWRCDSTVPQNASVTPKLFDRSSDLNKIQSWSSGAWPVNDTSSFSLTGSTVHDNGMLSYSPYS